MQRLGPDWLVGSKVLEREVAAIVLVEANHLLGDITFVETVECGLQRLRPALAGR